MQRRGAKATKKLGAGRGAYLASFFHVFLYTKKPVYLLNSLSLSYEKNVQEN